MVPAVDLFWESVRRSVLLVQQSNSVSWLLNADDATDASELNQQDVVENPVPAQPPAVTHSDTDLLKSVTNSSMEDKG